MMPERYVNLEAARARFGDRVDRQIPYFFRIDEPAARLVEVMEELPGGKGWAMFQRALSEGIDAVPGAPEAYRAFFAQVEDVPPWVDWMDLDRAGEVLFRAGPLGGMALGAGALVQGYLSPAGNKPLVFAGRLEEQAARRLNETSGFVRAVCLPGGMRRGAEGFQTTLKVRVMHAKVQRLILRSGRWDERRWGAPINQRDIVGTMLLFSAFTLRCLLQLGVSITPDDAERYHQLWRYVTLLIGGDPALVPASFYDEVRLGELIQMTEGDPDDDSRALVKALLNSPLTAANSPIEIRRARLQHDLGTGLVRSFHGEETAEKLGLPRTPWRHAAAVLRGITTASEVVRQRSPAVHRAMVANGRRYWDRVIEIGLAGATAEFRPPEALAARLASS